MKNFNEFVCESKAPFIDWLKSDNHKKYASVTPFNYKESNLLKEFPKDDDWKKYEKMANLGSIFKASDLYLDYCLWRSEFEDYLSETGKKFEFWDFIDFIAAVDKYMKKNSEGLYKTHKEHEKNTNPLANRFAV